MAKGRGFWLDSVGDRTGKRRVGRPSKSHCLEHLVWLTDGLERSLERAHSRLWGGDSNAADTANQVSIAPREGAIFWRLSVRQRRRDYFNPRPARGRFGQNCPVPSAFSLYLLPNGQSPKEFFAFFAIQSVKRGPQLLQRRCEPPLENAVRLAFAPLEYQRFCHVKARFGTDVLHLVLIAVPQIVKAQAVPLRVDDLF